MKIEFTGRHYHVSDRTREFTERKLAKLEKFLDDQGALYTASLAETERVASMPAQTSIDVRIQHAVTDELAKSITKFNAKVAE